MTDFAIYNNCFMSDIEGNFKYMHVDCKHIYVTKLYGQSTAKCNHCGTFKSLPTVNSVSNPQWIRLFDDDTVFKIAPGNDALQHNSSKTMDIDVNLNFGGGIGSHTMTSSLSTDIDARKGPFDKIWLAANPDNKLTKTQVSCLISLISLSITM